MSDKILQFMRSPAGRGFICARPDLLNGWQKISEEDFIAMFLNRFGSSNMRENEARNIIASAMNAPFGETIQWD